MDKHKIVRNHIAAAKGWLSQAEKSLDQENDIRGDLNLMLAQAELQSAQEKQPQRAWLRWGRRLLPLAVALCVAAGYVAYLRPVSEVPAAPPVMPVAAESVREADAVTMEPVTGSEQAAVVPAVGEAKVSEAPVSGRETAPSQTSDGEKAVSENAGPREPSMAGQAQAPDRELQKLMQAAGNVLRE